MEIFFLLVFYFIFNIYSKANENALRSNWRGGNRRGFSLLWRLLISLMKEFWSCITISSSIWYNGLKSFMNYNYTLYWLFHHFLIHCTEEEVGWSLSKRKVGVASRFLISHFYPYALGFSRWFKIRTLYWPSSFKKASTICLFTYCSEREVGRGLLWRKVLIPVLLSLFTWLFTKLLKHLYFITSWFENWNKRS